MKFRGNNLSEFFLESIHHTGRARMVPVPCTPFPHITTQSLGHTVEYDGQYNDTDATYRRQSDIQPTNTS